MSLLPTSARVQEPARQGFRFAPQPEPAWLKRWQLLPMKLFPAQLLPARRQVAVPSDTEMHPRVLRNAIHHSHRGLASSWRSSQFAQWSLWEWSGNRRLQNHAFQEKAGLFLQAA